MCDKSRKPGIAPVRHTLTSMYRLLKANPLLKYELKGQPLPESGNSTFKDKVPAKMLPKFTNQIATVKTTTKVNVNAAPKEKKPNLVRTQSARQAPNKIAQTTKAQPAVKTKHAPPTTNNKTNEIQKSAMAVERNVEFKTPMAYKRRSTVFATPNSCRPSFASTPGPSAYDLQKRLNDWLRKRGKPLKTYSNLKEFGIKHDTVSRNEENKENIEVEVQNKDDSYEDLGIIREEEVEEPQKNEQEVQKDLRAIAKNALKDLKKLILEGYAREQCEAWLGAIKEKYKELEQDPLYWECLAALEETVGHISTAVEYYKTAIVHGAEIKDVDDSLEQMLEKFSLLNIDSTQKNENNPEKPKYDRNKVVLAARNVFKSSIIQFAIEERKQKKGNKDLAMVLPEEKRKLVVTPVRRSTRRRTGYVVTPNVELCSSLEKMKESLIDGGGEVQFRHNHDLAAKFC